LEHPGQNLRRLREKMGLTLRDVETAAAQLARQHGNEEFQINLSRLNDLESKGGIPTIYRLYSLAVIYRLDLLQLLSWYGVPVESMSKDIQVVEPPRSHLNHLLDAANAAQLPVRLDPSFDPQRTCNFGRMIERWGIVPLSLLAQFAEVHYTYGYIGAEDFTMHPLLMPGSFIQVDESRHSVQEGAWRSEYERPIYFVETRDGFYCSWCAVKGDKIILQPHPLSPVAPRILKHPQEAEVIGQVVGIAMQLNGWKALDDAATAPKRSSLAQ